MFLRHFWKAWVKGLKRVPVPLFCFFISFYRAFFSASLMMGGSCRFYPSCSDYGLLVYKNYPFFKASRFLLKRLFSCHPFGPKLREEPEIKNFV
ncbi:MAG: membrane protein insertion efficiency factor YidD [Oligoflexia bacterium]|nr:membrane protein insertion efficiency factor YidD [Oligoflexia bacterium]